MKSLHKFLTKIEPPNWVLPILAAVTLFRTPTFFEPYYYGDEMIYLTLGNAIRKGVILYKQIHDNKPPLLYIIAAIGGNLFWFKAILCLWMLASTIAFWHLTKNLFKKRISQQIAIIAFAILTTIPLFEGNIANAELFLIGPIIIALTLILQNESNLNMFWAGLFFGIATLFKVPAIFNLPIITLLWLVQIKEIKELGKIITKTFILGVGFAVPILITFVWYYFQGALGDYIKIAFLQNIGYLSSWSGSQNTSFIVRNGPLLIRAAIVLIGLIILRIYNQKLSKTFIIATIWLLTSLFAATLSGRPYPHYMVQVVPTICVFIALLADSSKLEQVLTIIPLTLVIIVPVYYQFYYYSTTIYYQRFIKFATHEITTSQYFNEFDSQTTYNYELSQTIQKLSMTNDKIFVWGDDAPTIYALSRRLPGIKYTADYHITDFSSIKIEAQNLEQNPPKLIIILPNSKTPKEISELLIKKYVLITNSMNGEIWHLIGS